MSEKVLVTPAELSDMIKSEPIVLIDTRDPATYAAGHLPDAVNIHDIFTYLATSTPEGVAAMRDKFADIFGAAGLSGTETAVVYEQSMNSGFGQSCRGYVLLRYLGYPKLQILHGGYVAWTAAGLPTSTAVPTPERKSFAIDPSAAGILVDLANMKAAVADPKSPSSTPATSTSGSPIRPRPMARISARARDAFQARSGSNGTG